MLRSSARRHKRAPSCICAMLILPRRYGLPSSVRLTRRAGVFASPRHHAPTPASLFPGTPTHVHTCLPPSIHPCIHARQHTHAHESHRITGPCAATAGTDTSHLDLKEKASWQGSRTRGGVRTPAQHPLSPTPPPTRSVCMRAGWWWWRCATTPRLRGG
jgi:hypothetical protein